MTLTDRFLSIANIGAEWVLWVLVILSIFSIAAMAERIAFFFRTRTSVEAMRKRLQDFLDLGEQKKAYEHFSKQSTMEATVLTVGLNGYDQGPTAAGELMAGTLSIERIRYERNLNFMATLGANAPFIGLFGTVLGIINAFAALDLTGGTEVDDRIMGALAEALIATGVGLLVAIPAVIAFNLFKGRVKRSVANTDKLARTLVAHLSALPAPVAVAALTTHDAKKRDVQDDTTNGGASESDAPGTKKKAVRDA